MATGETKLSYLDVVDDIQDGDTVPILRDGKNYMSTGLAQVNADLTDLGGRIVEINNFTANTTYRFRFAGAVTSSRSIGFLYVRGQQSPQKLLLLVNGYGYSSARCDVVELLIGTAVSYEISSEIFAIDVTLTASSGGNNNAIGYFCISGVTPTIEAIS